MVLVIVFIAGMLCEATVHPVSKFVAWVQEISRKN